MSTSAMAPVPQRYLREAGFLSGGVFMGGETVDLMRSPGAGKGRVALVAGKKLQ